MPVLEKSGTSRQISPSAAMTLTLALTNTSGTTGGSLRVFNQ